MPAENIRLDALHSVQVTPEVEGVTIALCTGPMKAFSKRLTTAQALALGQSLMLAAGQVPKADPQAGQPTVYDFGTGETYYRDGTRVPA